MCLIQIVDIVADMFMKPFLGGDCFVKLQNMLGVAS